MKIKELKITGLFNQFDYTIPLDNPEGITILTGPNGYGKTMILNIIDSLFNKKFYFFITLIFNKIELILEDGIQIEIIKSIDEIKDENQHINIISHGNISYIEEDNFVKNINISLLQNGIKIETFKMLNDDDIELWNNIDKIFSLKKVSSNEWIDKKSKKILSLNDIINKNSNNVLEDIINEYYKKNINFPKISKILTEVDSLLIKEQRLYQNSRTSLRENETILKEYAKNLIGLISNTQSISYGIASNLDSTFPKRLIEEKNELNEYDFNIRFSKLKEKQDKLKKYGLTTNNQAVPKNFDKSNSKVLLVYLNDSEKKLKVFDELINKIEFFTDTINNHRFSNKYIQIDKYNGFNIITKDNKNLKLKNLSSGEQHEIVLLYELIFKTNNNTLVLIDEPEISLHITWQHEFLKDLLQIIKIQNIQVIVATHSPQIINEYWDLTVNLDRQIKYETTI